MMVSNLPLSSGVSGHLLSTGSPDPRQLPFGPGTRPYPASYPEAASGGAGLRSPVSCRLSATGNADHTVRLWDVAYLVNVVQRLCASAGRSLTRAEWARYVPVLPYQKVCP